MDDPVFVIRNQLGQYWTRAGEWVDGREPQRILKHRHRDEAVNQLVELSARDIDLRGEVLGCDLNARGEPRVDVSGHATPTLAEKAALEAANSEEQTSLEASDDTVSADGEATEPPSSAAV